MLQFLVSCLNQPLEWPKNIRNKYKIIVFITLQPTGSVPVWVLKHIIKGMSFSKDFWCKSDKRGLLHIFKIYIREMAPICLKTNIVIWNAAVF